MLIFNEKMLIFDDFASVFDLIFKKSGFRMFQDFKWSDFRSSLI